MSEPTAPHRDAPERPAPPTRPPAGRAWVALALSLAAAAAGVVGLRVALARLPAAPDPRASSAGGGRAPGAPPAGTAARARAPRAQPADVPRLR